MRRLFLLAMGFAAMCSPAQASPNASLEGPEFQVNTYTTGSQRVVEAASAGQFVARNPDGSVLIVWTDDPGVGAGQDGSGSGIRAQRYDAVGAAAGTEFQVNTFTLLRQHEPSATATGDGGFVVAWTSETQDGDGRSIQGQRLDTAGNPLGTEFQVNSYTTDDQYHPAVAAAADGSFVVVWGTSPNHDQDGSGGSIQGQRFDASGVPVGTEFQVNTYTTDNQQFPAVAVSADGGFTVVWDSIGQDGSGEGIYAQRFDAGGSPLGTEFRVNTQTDSVQNAPAVASTADGHVIVAWRADQDGSFSSVHARRYDPSGAPLTDEFLVNSYTTFQQFSPAVAATPDGNFLVAWSSIGVDGSDASVQAQGFDNTGTRIGGEFRVNTYTLGRQGDSVSIGADGTGFTVAWASLSTMSSSQDGDGEGMFGQRVRLVAGCAMFANCGDGNVTQGCEQCDDANGVSNDGCDACTLTPEVQVAAVAAGATLGTDDGEGDGATTSDVIETAVTLPASGDAGEVRISEQSSITPLNAGQYFLGVQVTIVAPGQTSAAPLVLTFRLDASLIPAGHTEQTLQIIRNGTTVPDCIGATQAVPNDPCVSGRALLGDGDVQLTVLTSSASLWTFSAAACPPVPRNDCQAPLSGKAGLSLKNPSSEKSSVQWKWTSGAELLAADFGDPRTFPDFTLCVYDDVAGTPSLFWSAGATAGGTCAGKPCWKAVGPEPSFTGFKYKDKDATPAGLTGASFKAGVAGKGKISVKGKGANLGLPGLSGVVLPLEAQLIGTNGECWQATYSTATTMKDDQIKATSD